MPQEKHLTFQEHLNELRWLLIRSVFIFVVLFIVYIAYYKQVSIFILSSLPGIKLVYLSPIEYMSAILSLAVILGLISIIPYLLVEFYVFARPALTMRENATALVLIPLILLALSGIIYLIYIYIPQILHLLLATQSRYAQPILSFNAVVDFIWLSGLILFMNCIIPVILIAITRILGISREQCISARPFIIVTGFLMGGLITTDDNLFVQAGFALWVIILYNIGIIFATRTLKNEPIQ